MSFFKLENTHLFTEEFQHCKFITIVNELFNSCKAKEEWDDLTQTFMHKYNAEVYNSGGNIYLCGIRLGGDYWISISDESYVLYSNAIANRSLCEIKYEDDALLLQGEYHCEVMTCD